MAKYRVVQYDFTYDFASWATQVFPNVHLTRPSIYLGTYFPYNPLANIISIGEQYGVMESKLFGLRALKSEVSGGRLLQPCNDLIGLIQSDMIDCTELEVIGDVTLNGDDLFEYRETTIAPFLSMVFLEKI